ncbi:MAG TPA: NAD(P)H-dependent oxidoreductase subunit E [Myxococcota bacterium]|nr:NAD(P)H-dependent oxidoreductase subunit E [Myxococcota bacterium]HRY96813.1 NAD(P)H-dependent oxidoreductase subunit E [Myxococcota bacterium]
MSAQAVIDPAELDEVLARHPQGQPAGLVNLLHDLQAAFRYLPEQALERAAEHLGLSSAEVYGVATFYEGFHLKPRGEHICTVCMGTACHVRGAARLLEQAERDLAVRAGQTTPDLRFTLEQVNCVGACALGPLVILDGKYHGSMAPDRLSRLLGKLSDKKGSK